EKQRSVPDTYPMSLNALVAGCNQKTSRSPIMNASEAEVLEVLDALKHRSLVVETSGGRVMRYAHNAERALGLPSQSAALLATLALRGPQTAAELRSNSDRLHRFADVSAVEGFLHELEERPSGALVAELPRSPGTRETRWVQLLTGPMAETSPTTPAVADAMDAAPHAPRLAALAAEIATLREDVAALKAAVAALQGPRTEDPARSGDDA
ncbi:MAG TPA: DUF480 domain-containing protein, partial [Casimicrobiaceae bacterium]